MKEIACNLEFDDEVDFFKKVCFNNIFVMLFVDLESGKIIFANNAASDFYGYSSEEFRDIFIFDINIMTKEEIFEKMEEAKEEKRNFFYFNHKIKNGEIKKVEVYSKPIDIQGKKILFSIIHDISETEKFKKEYEEKEKIRKLILENILSASDGIAYNFSSNKGADYWSENTKDILGYTVEDLKKNSKLWFDSVYEEDKKKVIKAIEDAKDGKAFEVIYRIYTKSGNIKWLKDRSIKFQKSENNEVEIQGIAFDITKEKDREIQLETERDKARKANEAKTEFLSNMSHELRTPLNGILGFTSILFDSEHLCQDECRDLIGTIKDSAESLLELVNKILNMSAIEQGRVKVDITEVNIVNFMYSLKNIFNIQLDKKNLKLEINSDKETENKILIDTTKLRQIMINLLNNAIKFTKDGYIEININLTPKNQYKGRLKIEVKDTGIGIDKNLKDRIFEEFVQGEYYLTKEYSGAGLGLNISKRLVTLMEGDLYFTSEKNKGSSFFLEFDVDLVKEKIMKEESKILVVEDNSVNIKYIIIKRIISLNIKMTN